MLNKKSLLISFIILFISSNAYSAWRQNPYTGKQDYYEHGSASAITGVAVGDGSTLTGTTTSSGIASAITDETGSGHLVFDTSPTFITQLTAPLVYGSSAANGDITIEGTSSATKTSSYVILQPTSGNVGINTTTPSTTLDVAGTITSSGGSASATFGDNSSATYPITFNLSGTDHTWTAISNGLAPSSGASLTSGTSAGNTMNIGAYDVDGGSITSYITATSNNSPSFAYNNFPQKWVATVFAPVSGDVVFLDRATAAGTITSINCMVDPADSSESVVLTINECDSNGDSCAGTDGATTITCGNTMTADDGSLSNSGYDAGDVMNATLGTVTGTVSGLMIEVRRTETKTA